MTDVVFVIHGVTSRSEWTREVRDFFESAGTHVISIGYGYRDLLGFLSPFHRRDLARRIAEQLKSAAPSGSDTRVSVIAHSLATSAAANALLENSDIELEWLILTGSVVPRTFPWSAVGERVRRHIINECGSRDVWPVLVSALALGYEPTGSVGFGNPAIRDRFHPGVGHRGFFTHRFMHTNWLPLIHGEPGNEVSPAVEPLPRSVQRLPWLRVLQILTLPIPLAAGLAVEVLEQISRVRRRGDKVSEDRR